MHTLPRPSRFFRFCEPRSMDNGLKRKVASASQPDGGSRQRSQTVRNGLTPHVGGNWRHDTTTPNGQKSNCLNDRSGKLNQLEANPLFSLSLLFFHPPPLSRDGKNCRRPSFSLSLTARRDSNGMAEITRICFSPLLSLARSLCTISRLTGDGARKKRVVG